MKKRLYRSTTDKKLLGVCAGIAEYFDVDPTIVRLLWAVVALFSFGTGLIAYIVAAFVLPDKPSIVDIPSEIKEEKKDAPKGPEIE